MKKEIVSHALNKIAEGDFLDPYDSNDEKILKTLLPDGTFVASHQIRAGFVFNPKNIKEMEFLLMTPPDQSGNWLILEQFKMGIFLNPEEFEDILLIKDKRGTTIAHHQAGFGYAFNTKKRLYLKLLLLQNKELLSVAHFQVLGGYRFNPEDEIENRLLHIRSKDGTTVAHYQAGMKRFFNPDNPIELEILKLSDKKGYSVAHTQAFKGYVFNVEKDTHYNLLKIKDVKNSSVASCAQDLLYKRLDSEKYIEILKLSDKVGYSVAHNFIMNNADIYAEFVHSLPASDIKEKMKKLLCYAFAESNNIFPVEGNDERIRDMLDITQSYLVKINIERNIPYLTATLKEMYNISPEIIDKIKILSNRKGIEKFVIEKLLMEDVVVDLKEEEENLISSIGYIDEIYKEEKNRRKDKEDINLDEGMESAFLNNLKKDIFMEENTDFEFGF